MKNFDEALQDWLGILGSDNVSTKSSDVERVESTTFATSTRVLAIIRPHDSKQLRECMRVAFGHGIAVYPTSRGRNCGYGSRVPYQSGSVVIDLGLMNRIQSYDEELGVVTIEPGVTQEQLASFLKAHGDLHCIDPIPTFPDCSVMGNILERGHGMTAYADRVASACDFEVVLPTGELVQTGYSAIPNARAKGLDRWAPGPNLDGLFSQSNFGIVTRMSVWLMPKPEFVSGLAFSIASQDQFENVIDLLRPLRLDGTLRFGPRLFNEYRLLETFSRYPFEEAGGQFPLPEKVLAAKMREFGIPLWSGIVGFYGSRERVAVDEARVRKAIEKVTQHTLVVNEETNAQFAGRESSVFEKFVRSNLAAMQGHVLPVTQRPRWRKRKSKVSGEAPNAALGDWSLEKCGIIWMPVTSPFRGRDARAGVELYRNVVRESGFEPDMSVSSIRDRTLEINASIVFDREDPAQEEGALLCASKVIQAAAEAGFYPHRVGIPTMHILERVSPELRNTWQSLRQTFDPKGILAGGRYVSSDE